MQSHDSLAWLDGAFLPRASLAIQIDDLGFTQGVTAVERLRTWDGQLPLLPRHLERFRHSIDSLKLKGVPPGEELGGVIQKLLSEASAGASKPLADGSHSRSTTPTPAVSSPKEAESPSLSEPLQVALNGSGMPRLDGGQASDIGVTLLATAGRPASDHATVAVHLNPLDHSRLAGYWHEGQPLILTNVVQPPPESWPREIKVRCRLHYYLADLYARERNPAAIGVLLDTDGCITEASTCNLFISREDHLVAPPRGRVLPGIMGETVCQIAHEMGMKIQRRPLEPSELRGACIWLTGSEGGLWFASSFDGQPCPIDPKLRTAQTRLRNYLTSTEKSIQGGKGERPRMPAVSVSK